MKNLRLIVSVTLIAAALTFMTPQISQASLIFSPFGGKVWIPPFPAPGCEAILSPINLALTAAALLIGSPVTIQIEVDQLSIQSGTTINDLGILKIGPGQGGVVTGPSVVPFPITYRNYNYYTPDVWVLGNSINLCNFCDATKNIPGASSICKNIPYVSTICNAIADTSCPVTNLIYQIGTGLVPDTGQNTLGGSK